MKATKLIRKNQFHIWYELFKNSGGRLLANPRLGQDVRVSYEFEDIQKANDFESEYYRLITPIVETRRSLFKRIKLAIGL
ncbi:MAG: hypothetical protein EOO52_13300 [Gammaproteobacteria bacterium]|nr:MAG: hypothetical protein EOO52_13300 [Gammaproteobacteria bacterium]